jgi:hypothetical protein
MADGSKHFGKEILNNPTKYFTEDIMHKLDLACETEFKYGSKEIEEITLENEVVETIEEKKE